MNKTLIFGAVFVIAILALAYVAYGTDDDLAPIRQYETSEEAVRATVETFGSRMKMVSTLAPREDVENALDESYTGLVVDELLTAWKYNPTQSPGRTVSSPVPERIEIVTIGQRDTATYRVEGNVIETTGDGTPAGVYAVTLDVEDLEGRWLITRFEKGPYAELSREVTLTGSTTCLPHKDTSGPQTLECAIGLQTGASTYYGLDMTLQSEGTFLDTGKAVTVTGVVVPVEAMSSIQKYDIKGVMRVTALQEN